MKIVDFVMQALITALLIAGAILTAFIILS